jgi:hypothetical protein
MIGAAHQRARLDVAKSTVNGKGLQLVEFGRMEEARYRVVVVGGTEVLSQGEDAASHSGEVSNALLDFGACFACSQHHARLGKSRTQVSGPIQQLQ